MSRAQERRRVGYRLMFVVEAIVEGRGKPKQLRKEFFEALSAFVGMYFAGRMDSTSQLDGTFSLKYEPEKH